MSQITKKYSHISVRAVQNQLIFYIGQDANEEYADGSQLRLSFRPAFHQFTSAQSS